MRSRTFAVIGLGTFGATIATDLTQYGDTVLAIDIADGPVNALADVVRETAIADARDEDALREAGVGQCHTAVIAIGNSLEANIVAAVNAKVIGVNSIWAKATSKTHHRILSRLGVDRVIQPSRQMGVRAALMLHNPLVRDYASLGNGFYAVTINVTEDLDGRTLSSLRLKEDFGLACLEVMRGTDRLTEADGETRLREDDRLLILGRRSALREFSDSVI